MKEEMNVPVLSWTDTSTPGAVWHSHTFFWPWETGLWSKIMRSNTAVWGLWGPLLWSWPHPLGAYEEAYKVIGFLVGAVEKLTCLHQPAGGTSILCPFHECTVCKSWRLLWVYGLKLVHKAVGKQPLNVKVYSFNHTHTLYLFSTN